MVSEGYDPLILVELQTSLRALEVEVIGRYVSEPTSLNKIRLALAEAFDRLAELKETTEVIEEGNHCPAGWVHRASCDCIPMSSAASLASGESGIQERRRASLDEWRKG